MTGKKKEEENVLKLEIDVIEKNVILKNKKNKS